MIEFLNLIILTSPLGVLTLIGSFETIVPFGIIESNPTAAAHRALQTWLKTDPGQWILEHSVEEPYIVWYENAIYGGYTYRMMARLRKQDQTFFKMKFK